MKAREFQMFLSTTTGATLGEVDQRTRFLREAGLIKSGARGSGAPDINAVEAACMILAMISRRASDAAQVFHRANMLPAVPRKISDRLFLDGATLGAVTASAISSPVNWNEGLTIDRIEIEESGEFAWVRMGTMSILFTDDEKVRDWITEFPDTYDKTCSSLARRCFVVGGALLEHVALKVTEQDAPAEYAEA